MYRLDVLQNQMLFLFVIGGAVIALLAVLTYLMMWQARGRHRGGQVAEPVQGLGAVWRSTPWVLIAIYIAAIVYGLMFTILQVVRSRG